MKSCDFQVDSIATPRLLQRREQLNSNITCLLDFRPELVCASVFEYAGEAAYNQQ